MDSDLAYLYTRQGVKTVRINFNVNLYGELMHASNS